MHAPIRCEPRKTAFISATMKSLTLILLTTATGFCSAAAVNADLQAKLLAVHPMYDTNRDGSLSVTEQLHAVSEVKRIFGDAWAQQIFKMFVRAEAADKTISTSSWKKQVEALGAEPVKKTFKVAMQDGVNLATDVFLPEGDGPFPVVLARTPYGRAKQGNQGRGFVENGLVLVVQDARGRFESEGENLPFIGCGWDKHTDGAETVAWIRKQPWCNGSIGTVGGSAGGITQNLLAGTVPEGLKAQHIAVAAASLYSDASYIGGAFRKADLENWLGQNKFDPQALALMHAHPAYDDYWKGFDTTLKYEVMNVPAVHQGGWFDMFAQATLDEFAGRQHRGAAGSRGTQKLIMGPWVHGLGKMPVGELTFPNSQMPATYNAARWFDHYLGGIDNGVEKEPAVTYYVMGDLSTPGAPGNEWRHADDWPVPATETPFYFGPDGVLTSTKTAAGNAKVEYTFDPANPCPTVGGNNLTLAQGPMNQNRIEDRDDVVLFTTAPLTDPLEVTGRVRARVFVSSSAANTDLSVRLCDVYPDGKSYLMAEGILRLSHRKSMAKPEPLTPGRVEEVTVDCWSTSLIFNKGHRIRATVTSSNFPRFDINPGTGAAWSESGEKVKQTNHIYCDAEHPSGLLLPVVRSGGKS